MDGMKNKQTKWRLGKAKNQREHVSDFSFFPIISIMSTFFPSVWVASPTEKKQARFT
jgi:hypothetical protein